MISSKIKWVSRGGGGEVKFMVTVYR